MLTERFGCGGLDNHAHLLDAMRDSHLGAILPPDPAYFRGARRIADLVDLGDGSLKFGKDAQDMIRKLQVLKTRIQFEDSLVDSHTGVHDTASLIMPCFPGGCGLGPSHHKFPASLAVYVQPPQVIHVGPL